MDATLRTAFETASGTEATTLTFVIAATLSAALLYWLAWLALAGFKSWQSARVSEFDFLWNLLRAAVVVLLLGFFVR